MAELINLFVHAPTFSIVVSATGLVVSASSIVSGLVSTWFGSGFDSTSVTCTFGTGTYGAFVCPESLWASATAPIIAFWAASLLGDPKMLATTSCYSWLFGRSPAVGSLSLY